MTKKQRYIKPFTVWCLMDVSNLIATTNPLDKRDDPTEDVLGEGDGAATEFHSNNIWNDENDFDQ